LVERVLTLQNQGLIWSASYGILVVLVLASAVMLWRSNPAPAQQEKEEEEEAEEPLAGDPLSGGGSPQTSTPSLSGGLSTWRRLRWVGLTFVPSSLMLGVTSFATTDITPIPLLWVIPLSLYLFSFVIVFSPSQRMPDLIHKAMVAALPAMMTLLVIDTVSGLSAPYWMRLALHILGFFVVAMVLHGEVARDRPPARHLTEFYLWVAVGGVLGGIFNAVIAPIAFDTVVEYPLAIILACLFLPGLVLSNLLGGGDRRRTQSSRGQESGATGDAAERSPGEGEEGEQQRSSGRSRPGRFFSLRFLLDLALPLALGGTLVALGAAVNQGYLDSLNFERVELWDIFIGLAAGLACLWFAYVSAVPSALVSASRRL
jgi:hypothetical protein